MAPRVTATSERPGLRSFGPGARRGRCVDPRRGCGELVRPRPSPTTAGALTLRPLEALYITGHSLGGAMAAVMTAMLLETPQYGDIADKLRGVYTFGQPMVAGPDRAAVIDRVLSERAVPMIRYVYRDDPVPSLPPAYIGTYQHFGAERRFLTSWPAQPSGTTVQSPPYRLDLATSFVAATLRKIAPLRNLPFTRNLEHHFPLAYITSLNPSGVPTEFGD